MMSALRAPWQRGARPAGRRIYSRTHAPRGAGGGGRGRPARAILARAPPAAPRPSHPLIQARPLAAGADVAMQAEY